MTVRVFTPAEMHHLQDVHAVDVEGLRGALTLLPRHIDCAVALTTGLVRVETNDHGERHLGVDGGTLVKIGDQVMISTPRIATGDDLGTLRESVMREHRLREERGRHTRQALARLEIELARSIFDEKARP